MPTISRYKRHIIQNVFMILLLWHQCFTQDADPVPPNSISFSGAFITLYGYASKGAKLERHTCRSMLHCGHLCLKNSKCSSFNYQILSPHNGLCELSEESIVSKEEHDTLKKMPGVVFVQTERKDLKPRSCIDHLHAGRRYSGFYTIFDNEGTSFQVYCDLTTESRGAWTLFMSERTPGSGLFMKVPLYVDQPMNEESPNWNAFRLSISKMKQLRSRSTHWRVTCSFQLDGLVLRDYVRAKIAEFDPIDFKGRCICKRVEYMNVRGHNCSDSDVAWWQQDAEMLHHDSSNAHCGFDPSPGAVASEDDFGSYQCYNPKFRCTESAVESTTNHWFGSYLEKH